MNAPTAVRILSESEWRERQAAHEARVRRWTDPHQARAARGEKHPVYDFLFSYYAFRPAWLRRWHPGPEVALAGAGAREFLRWPEYREIAGDGTSAVAVDSAALPGHRRPFVTWLRDLLGAMQARPAFFGCFGLHEWAMVYRTEDVRHSRVPLRIAAESVVESMSLRCTHYDAFRFFTPAAVPRNRVELTRDGTTEHDQPGCVHVTMDLYKFAYKLAPWVPSEVIAEAFELAAVARELDMRASPYDLRDFGFTPIRIETKDGREEYVREQRELTKRAEPVRAKVRAAYKTLL